MGPRGGVGLGVADFSSGPKSLNLGSRGGQGLCEMAMSLLEGGARVADGDGHEFHLSPYHREGGNEWGVLGGLLLEPLLTSEVLAESDLEEDQDALLAVESVWVWRGGVRYPSGVDEVGGGAISRPEYCLLGLDG